MPRANFTHLLKPDAQLMEEFLQQFPDLYSHVDYDVHVGSGRDPGPEFPDNIRQMAIQLSQRRIDAVAHAADHIDIIEVTLDAGLTALGQLMAYPPLYIAMFNPSKIVRPLLVTRHFATDIEPMFKLQNIPTILIPE